MKLLKKLVNNKNGFTLMEAVAATALVAIAASMSVGVFTSNAKVNMSQYNVSEGQNDALSNAEGDLSTGGSSSDGDLFVMTPVNGGGFASLENNGAVKARAQKASNVGGDVNYKYFKYEPDQEATTEATTEEPYHGHEDVPSSKEDIPTYPVGAEGEYNNWEHYWKNTYKNDWRKVVFGDEWQSPYQNYMVDLYGSDYNKYWNVYNLYVKKGNDPNDWVEYWNNEYKNK